MVGLTGTPRTAAPARSASWKQALTSAAPTSGLAESWIATSSAFSSISCSITGIYVTAPLPHFCFFVQQNLSVLATPLTGCFFRPYLSFCALPQTPSVRTHVLHNHNTMPGTFFKAAPTPRLCVCSNPAIQDCLHPAPVLTSRGPLHLRNSFLKHSHHPQHPCLRRHAQ